MTWYAENLDRSIAEREAVEALANTAEWLTLVDRRVDDKLRLIVEFDIQVGDRTYPALMRYPNHFPFGPPIVLPRGDLTRWSGHQYGAGGELCLEWRPDNWHPNVTGAQIIESAFALLQGENPNGPNTGTVVSAHKTTIGQDLRTGNYSRILLTSASKEQLLKFHVGVAAHCTLVGVYHKEAAGLAIESVESNGAEWKDAGVPPQLGDDGSRRRIPVLKLPDNAGTPPASKLSSLNEYLTRYGASVDENGHVLIIIGDQVFARFIWKDSDSASTIPVMEPEPSETRLSDSSAPLKGKIVAVVGCGSMGSKIATSLARSGVGNFLLVDDDVLYPGNLVRNDLDWRDIATHKADALARRLEMVNPTVDVIARKHRLGGQEASSSFESMISTLAKCDLIIDATAEPDVFNFLNAAASHGRKALLWCEVFGGGIGGLIARSRPGKDADPATARAIIEGWCASQGKPLPKPAARYGVEAAGAMIADDADVSVIAAHAGRFAIDILLQREPSSFPVSAYIIALARAWAFEAPFETYPIDLGPAKDEPEYQSDNPEKALAELHDVIGMINKLKRDETENLSSNSPAA